GRLRELDVAVVDDLHAVAPRVDEVEEPARQDGRAGRLERLARRLLVVHDEAEVPLGVGRLRAPFRERDELGPHLQEGHVRERGLPYDLELEDPAVPLDRLLEAPDLERDVVDPDQPGHPGERTRIGSVAVRPQRVYETVVYAPDLEAAAAFYRDVLGLRQVED